MKKEANELTTARLVLRHWSEADAPALFSLAADPAIGLAAGWSPHRSEAESREVIRTVFAAPEVYAVTMRGNGEAITRLGAVLVDVSEQNPQAAGFYRHLGFSVFSRDATDGQGRPFPILHLRMGRQE